MRRFPIRTLMAFVLVCALGLVALKNVNHQRARMMPLVALASVCVAMVEVVILRGKARYWCVGFVFFCGCYLAFAFPPWLTTRVQPISWTSDVLTELFSRIYPLTAGGAKMEQINRTSLSRPAQLADFRRVGHSLFALLAGLLGGMIATWFYGRRQTSEPPTASSDA